MRRAIRWLWISIAFWPVIGCGNSWQNIARDGLTVVARGVTAGAENTAANIRTHCRRPGEGSAAVHACMHEHAYDLAFTGLVAIDSAAAGIDDLIEAEIASSAPSPDFLRAVSCLTRAVAEAQTGLTVARVEIPAELVSGLNLLSAFAGAQCAP